jgi:PAS domain S-box-containing protein
MARRGRTATAVKEGERPQASVAELEARIAALSGELRAKDERYGLVSQAVAEGIYEWDIERDALWVSSRLIEIFGFEGRDLTAADWNSLVHTDDFPSYQAAVRDCLKGVAPRLDCEYRVRHSDGTSRWIEDRAVPVRNGIGRALRWSAPSLTSASASKPSASCTSAPPSSKSRWNTRPRRATCSGSSVARPSTWSLCWRRSRKRRHGFVPATWR